MKFYRIETLKDTGETDGGFVSLTIATICLMLGITDKATVTNRDMLAKLIYDELEGKSQGTIEFVDTCIKTCTMSTPKIYDDNKDTTYCLYTESEFHKRFS